MKEKRIRFEVGRGLQGDLTDLKSKRILTKMKPYTRKRDFFRSILVAIDEVEKTLVKDNISKIEKKTIVENKKPTFSYKIFFIIVFTLFVIFVVIMALIIAFYKGGGGYSGGSSSSGSNLSNGGFSSGSSYDGGFFSGGSTGSSYAGGGGGFDGGGASDGFD